MPRARRLHKLDPAEHTTVKADLHSIDASVQKIYALAVERFGRSAKQAQRLRALQRKLSEVMDLLSEAGKTESLRSNEEFRRANRLRG
ncbi:MAG: hypothetical protein ACREYF_28100 [Gammaproteobacteria bacterium]